MQGININSKGTSFTELIMSGKKTIETRDGKSYSALDKHIGKRVGIVTTGCGKATLEGYVTISGKIVYDSEEDFRKDFDKHRVNPDSKFWYGKSGKDGKVGYLLTDIQLLPFGKSLPLDSTGIITREVPDESEYTENLDGFERLGAEDGWTLYRKLVNGKGYWLASRKNFRPFHITYDQARGYEPIGRSSEIQALSHELGKILLGRR